MEGNETQITLKFFWQKQSVKTIDLLVTKELELTNQDNKKVEYY